MSYRLINLNDLNVVVSYDEYEKILKMPCIYVDLPNGMDGKHYCLTNTIEQEPCEDAISRSELLKALDTWDKFGYRCAKFEKLDSVTEKYFVPYIHYDDVVKAIKGMPSIQPKPKTGHWRHYESMLICSECGTEFYDDIMEYCGDDVPKCCPDCGAKMESEDKK